MYLDLDNTVEIENENKAQDQFLEALKQNILFKNVPL